MFRPKAVLAMLIVGCAAHTPAPVPPGNPPPTTVRLDALKEGERVLGWQVQTLYTDAADQPMGARFKHVATGFQLDYLVIDSVLQGFILGQRRAHLGQGWTHAVMPICSLARGTGGRRLGSARRWRPRRLVGVHRRLAHLLYRLRRGRPPAPRLP